MNDSTTEIFPRLTTLDRFRAMFAVILAGVVFLAVASPLLLAPRDPAGCVSVLTCQYGWWIIPACALLALLVAATVCWLAGAKLEETGVFGVALGLSMAALPYENASYLWHTFGQGSDAQRKALAADMTLESAGWLLVLVGAYSGSRLVMRYLKSEATTGMRPGQELLRGALTTLCIVILAVLLLPIFSTGTEVAPIETGQTYFACALTFYLAALVAYQLTAARSAVWSYIAVAVTALVGYGWIMLSAYTPSHAGRAISHLSHFPPTAFGRALPIQMIMLGLTGTIFGHWHQRQLARFALHEEGGSA